MKKRDDSNRVFFGLLGRYLIIVILGFPNLWLFYQVFSPITIYPATFLFDLLYDVNLIGNTIEVFNNGYFPIDIIDACVAGSAYYLLLILNMSISGIKIKKRLTMIGFAFSSLLVVNIMRIFILGILFVAGSEYFDITHKLMWYGLSGILIAFVWLAEIKIFELKEIPIYSDLKSLYKVSSLNKK
jgi:exosortase/archaeosortase family protein